MNWDKSAFQELADQVIQSLKGRPLPAGVPFFIYVYDPKDENKCIREFQSLARRLENQGFSIQIIYLGRVLSHVLKSTPYLKPEGKKIESAHREELGRELRTTLPERISSCLLEGISGQFQPIKGKEPSTGIFLLRAGALFPFVHISQILAHLESRTHATVVVPFAGSRKRENLRFLNETEGRYYRAMIFGR